MPLAAYSWSEDIFTVLGVVSSFVEQFLEVREMNENVVMVGTWEIIV